MSVVRKVLSVGTFPNRIVFSTVYYSYSAYKIISIPAVYGTVKDVMFVLVTYISEVKFNYPSLVYLKAYSNTALSAQMLLSTQKCVRFTIF